MGAATLLSASLKFDGTLIIQAQSKGPIQLLVVECKSDLSMRATVKLSVDADSISPNATLGELLDADNTGRLVITLDPADRKPGQPLIKGLLRFKNIVALSSSRLLVQQKLLLCTCKTLSSWIPAFG